MEQKRKKMMPAVGQKLVPYDNASQEMSEREEQAVALIREELFAENNYSNLQQVISQTLFAPLRFYSTMTNKYNRTASDLQETFDCFKRILREVQKSCAYTPTLCTFLQFANMTDITFRNYLEMKNEMGDVAHSIKNFLSEQTIQGVWGGTTKEISGIFTMKAMYGFRENEQPQTNIININSQERSVEDILSEFNKISR